MGKMSQVQNNCNNCGVQTYHNRILCPECGDNFKCSSCGIVCYPGFPETYRIPVGNQQLCSKCKSRLKVDGRLTLAYGDKRGKLLFRSGYTKRPNRDVAQVYEDLRTAMRGAGIQLYKD